MLINDGDFGGAASGAAAISALQQVLHEKEKTKRLLIGAACFFLCVACVIVIFAPPGKEQMSYIIGAALLVMALGAIGTAQFKFTVPGVKIEANKAASTGAGRFTQGHLPVNESADE